MKIVERLVKEGSSADEPLNIQLSDYSSDEGDTSSSSDNEGKAGNYSDYEGPCCQPLKVPPCSPVLTVVPRKEEKKSKKKSKSKSSSHHKRNRKIHRTVLELPTTDPGSDLQFSTDDEAYVEMDGYGTIPRTHRTHLQNELQRRLQSEVQQTDQQMPPELIVTPAKHKSIESLVLRLDDKPKKSSPAGQLEFPPIAGTTRRTSSWHNLNKCGQKIRIANTNYMETTENLQIKLSLKKQIWTGVMTGVTYGDKNIPLSWGVPPVMKKKPLQIIKDDSEALLTACSQKLVAWQQNELNKYRDDVENSLESGNGKGKVNINLVVPEMNEKQQQYRGRKSACSSNKTPTKLEQTQQSALNEPPKHKKRRNPLSRIAETTQILSRLAKSKVKASTSQKKSLSNSILSTANTGISIFPPLAPLTKTHHNKFKTGGLVATAVQPIKKKKIRLMASNTTITTTKNQENVVGETDADKQLKKVKSKTKRKKSKVIS